MNAYQCGGKLDIRLRIELLDTDPLVWRRVLVPEQINLHRLHEVIQAVMGWEGQQPQGIGATERFSPMRHAHGPGGNDGERFLGHARRLC